jgi:hypothetical protein
MLDRLGYSSGLIKKYAKYSILTQHKPVTKYTFEYLELPTIILHLKYVVLVN